MNRHLIIHWTFLYPLSILQLLIRITIHERLNKRKQIWNEQIPDLFGFLISYMLFISLKSHQERRQAGYSGDLHPLPLCL